jgi:hypothetical protein
MTFRLPTDSEHVAIIGRNGSGKTQFGTWMLSERSWDQIPWIVINSKGEAIFYDIPGVKDYSIVKPIPKEPGIYVATPIVADTDDKIKLDVFFHRCWERQNVGVFVDEGYVATGLRWFRAMLTQGRSRRVTSVLLFQRPAWADRFVWSEASQFVAFDLNMDDDKLTVKRFGIPAYRDVKLKPFHSLWHNVKTDETIGLTPVPDAATILARFRERAPIRRHVI